MVSSDLSQNVYCKAGFNSILWFGILLLDRNHTFLCGLWHLESLLSQEKHREVETMQAGTFRAALLSSC